MREGTCRAKAVGMRMFRTLIGGVVLFTMGCASADTASDDEGTSEDEVTTVGLHASETRGGFEHLTWNGGELATGGGFYIIASCSGKDDADTNMDSGRGTGRLTTPDGRAPSCAAPAYAIHFSGSNPITATIEVGPLPAALGALMFTLDLDKALFPDFVWDGASTGWKEGCANDYKDVLGRTSGVVSAIRAPCTIPGVGKVGLAERLLVNGVGAALYGGVGKLDLHVQSVSYEDKNGNSIDSGREFSITNHPGTHALGAGVSSAPVGATYKATVQISFSDPPAKTLACGHLPSGTSLGRNQTVLSCDGRFRLTHQTDGNVVLYRRSDNRPLWQTGTAGKATTTLSMQTDGNLVLYGSSVLWQSGTPGKNGAALSIQNDGNVVLYAKSGGALWQTHTY